MVGNTSLATSKKVKGEEKTCWHNLVLWDKRAEFVQKHFKKGDVIRIEGEIDNRSYDDRDGNKKYISEVIVTHADFVPGARQAQQQERPAQSQPAPQDEQPAFDPDGDIPF